MSVDTKPVTKVLRRYVRRSGFTIRAYSSFEYYSALFHFHFRPYSSLKILPYSLNSLQTLVDQLETLAQGFPTGRSSMLAEQVAID